MSFVDLLFPQAQLEALGNRWHEPAPKRRRLDSNVQGERRVPTLSQRHNSEPGLDQRPRGLSTSVHSKKPLPSPTQVKASSTKRSYSQSQASTASAINKSCLPSFIEPSILKNYLQHLHPNDRHRYSVPNSPRSEAQTNEAISQHHEEHVHSPASLTSDSASPASSNDNPPTPATICDQFRSGPFGHIFDGMRITDHERNLMDELLNPSPMPVLVPDDRAHQKQTQQDHQVRIVPEGYYDIEEALVQRMFPNFADRTTHDLEKTIRAWTVGEQDQDVHSSGMSPVPKKEDDDDEEDEETYTSPAGIAVSYDYSALSVDDFFDLEEAST